MLNTLAGPIWLDRLPGTHCGMARTIQREFLDWRRPALAAAAEFLRARFGRVGELDLGGVIVVVPGARAGRRLIEILVALADERELALTPPEVVTPDQFPEKLYQPRFQFADSLTQQLAWLAALKSLAGPRLAAFLPHPPALHDTLRWLAVAESLRRLHLELAADGLDCKSVLAQAAAVEGFAEQARWQALCQLQRAYLDTLDTLELWDVQTARLVAIDKREIATDKQIVLLGMADLNKAQRRMLDLIADRVTSLIVAPPELADRFDEHGCLVPQKWTEAELPLDDQQIERVDGPAEQTEAVTRFLASLEGQYRADEIAVGLADERLAPQIERQLAQCGVASRFAEAKKISETAPFRLLRAAADYAARRRFRDLAALVRHPDVYERLASLLPLPLGEGRGEGSQRHADLRDPHPNPLPRGEGSSDWLTALDEYASEHFPARVERSRLEQEPGAAAVLAIYEVLESLLAGLDTMARPLAEWADRLRAVLTAVYGERRLNRDVPSDRYLLAALTTIRDGLDALGEPPRELQPALDARQACRLLLDSLADKGLAPPANPDAVELLGWLELPLDDAPALAVTTFNEGYVPSAMTADAFLPDRLRQALGLLDNDRRLARDAYALSVLLASRRKLQLIVAHRDAEGNPLAPSRLLFATDLDRVVSRARTFFGELPPSPPRRNLLVPASGPRQDSLLAPPKPQPLAQPIRELSVTKFRDYIACPYRFYLRHVLELRALSDEAAELDGGEFGNLVHFALEQFGRSPEAAQERASTEAEPIIVFLNEQLDRIASARYGKHARPAVHVQVEQARLRLAAFAQWQAARTGAGWRIVFSEDSENRRQTLTTAFEVDGQPFTLRGRIDRIDYHAVLQRLCVLDYKTADAGDKPQQTHRRRDEWIDLQLPLYRHLVSAAGLPAEITRGLPIELGYILLPRDLAAVGLALAEWDEAALLDADERAREIIRHIWAGKFWPPAIAPDYFDDLAVICQDHRLGSWQTGEEGGAA